jgi:two-component sensor histidine kinase
LERRFNARARRSEQTTERLEEETERRIRLEATLRDTLIERDKDLRLRDFLISEIEHRTANAFQLTAAILRTQESESSSVEIRDALKLAAERIVRIGEMHAHLTFQASESHPHRMGMSAAAAYASLGQASVERVLDLHPITRLLGS